MTDLDKLLCRLTPTAGFPQIDPITLAIGTAAIVRGNFSGWETPDGRPDPVALAEHVNRMLPAAATAFERGLTMGLSLALLTEQGSFQARNAAWMAEAMADDPTDLPERVARFGEEALELQQSLGQSREDAHALVDYVFDRPIGEPAQELGGTRTTLALLAVVAGLDEDACGERELDRCRTPAVLAKIRGKRATRAGRGPLPGVTPTTGTRPDPVEAYPVRRLISDEVDKWPEGWKRGDPPTVAVRYVAAPVVKRSHSA